MSSESECQRCGGMQRVHCPGPCAEGPRCYGRHMSHKCPDCTGSPEFLQEARHER